MNILTLPIRRTWFDLTDPKLKTEEYREINNHWATRLMEKKIRDQHGKPLPDNLLYSTIVNNLAEFNKPENFKKFDITKLTLGYPRRSDITRHKKFQNLGIQIRQGNPSWGATPYKIYFVILHGQPIPQKCASCHHDLNISQCNMCQSFQQISQS